MSKLNIGLYVATFLFLCSNTVLLAISGVITSKTNADMGFVNLVSYIFLFVIIHCCFSDLFSHFDFILLLYQKWKMLEINRLYAFALHMLCGYCFLYLLCLWIHRNDYLSFCLFFKRYLSRFKNIFGYIFNFHWC